MKNDNCTFTFEVEIDFSEVVHHKEAAEQAFIGKFAKVLLTTDTRILNATVKQLCRICGEHVGRAGTKHNS